MFRKSKPIAWRDQLPHDPFIIFWHGVLYSASVKDDIVNFEFFEVRESVAAKRRVERRPHVHQVYVKGYWRLCQKVTIGGHLWGTDSSDRKLGRLW